MIREFLVKLIYYSSHCPDYKCENGFLKEKCMKCANKELSKYENEIYNKALIDLWLKVTSKYDEYLSLEELDVCIEELKEAKYE